MFTGIVKDTSKVVNIKDLEDGKRILLSGSEILGNADIGESISVSGACLTVEENGEDSAVFYLMDESLDKTWFSNLEENDVLNIEPSLRPKDRMGGHVVQGHVESSAEILEIGEDGDSWVMRVELPEDLRNYVVEKGFVAVEGVSLTVTRVEQGFFEVCLIPETLKSTNLFEKNEGSFVNLETDVTARYIEKMVG